VGTATAATDTLPASRDYYSLARMLHYARGSDQAQAAAKRFTGKPLTNAETGIRAVVSNGSLDKMLHESSWKKSTSRQAHSHAIANTDTLFAFATHRLSRPDRKGSLSIKTIHHFDAPMPFEGRVLMVKLLVKEMANKALNNPLYTLSAVEIQQPSRLEGKVDGLSKETAPDGECTSEGGSGSTVLDGYADKLSAMVAQVKRGIEDAAMTSAINDTETTHSPPVSQTETAPYTRARALIDAAHDADPTKAEDGRAATGAPARAAELVYADRVEAWVVQLVPDASPTLRLAARCQHLERFLTPRSTYAQGRVGYLKWRTFLYKKQAERARQLALEAGLPAAEADQIARWVSKTDLRKDAGSQALEDAAILVFLENEIGAFAAQHADYPREKFIEILRKTWRKLSPTAQPHARALKLPPAIADLVRAALAEE